MELINNTTKTLKDDLSVEIKQGSKLSIAAACFSIYAFQELKEQLKRENLSQSSSKMGESILELMEEILRD